MPKLPRNSRSLILLAMIALPAGGAFAQYAEPQDDVVVTGQLPALSEMTEGPEIEGIITARDGNRIQVAAADGTRTEVNIGEATQIKSSGGFLGLERNQLASDALLNGIPVSVETLQWDGGLVASKISLKNKDLRTAEMIRNATDQRFARNEDSITRNAAATEALRGRMGDIDQYNVKATTNVNFDTGKTVLSEQAKNELCQTAMSAEEMENALLLVVGYTDSTGTPEINQELSEKRAARVVNYLQQACGWKPYRMLTPTGMAEADPLAPNDTVYGKAQNRRVAVNVLVSKAIDGL